MKPRMHSFADELRAIIAYQPSPELRRQRKMRFQDETGNAKVAPYSDGAMTTAPVDGGRDVASNLLNPATGPGGV